MPDSSPLDLLKQARVHNLLKVWATAKRTLTAKEIAEIRELHPEFDPQSKPAGGEPSTLAAEPEAEVTAADIERWSGVYKIGRRQFFRYLGIGRTKGDPCPLNDPASMPKWWGRNMKQRCPENILLAAQKATAEAPPPAAASAQAPSTSGEESLEGFDLDAAELGEGEEVALARQTLKAFAGKLREATKSGVVEDIAFWHGKVKDAQRTLKETRSEDREERKARGLLMSRAEFELQVAGVVKVLFAMRAVMAKRVADELRRLFPDLPADVVPAAVSIVEAQREKEDELFRDLSAVKSPEDVFRLVA